MKWLFSVKDPSSRLLRWRLRNEEYDYKIEYVQGKDNKAAGALLRVLPVQDFQAGGKKHILGDVERQLEYEFSDNVEPGIVNPVTSKHPESQIRNDDQSLKSVGLYEQVDSPAGSHESLEQPENEVQQYWNPESISVYYRWPKTRQKTEQNGNLTLKESCGSSS